MQAAFGHEVYCGRMPARAHSTLSRPALISFETFATSALMKRSKSSGAPPADF
jgi:hypothetical protein